MRKVQPEKIGGIEMEKPSNMPTEYYPSVCLDQKALPEAKDWKVGKTYDVTLRLVMTGQSMRKGRNGKESGHFDFDIIGVDDLGEVKGKPKRYSEVEKTT